MASEFKIESRTAGGLEVRHVATGHLSHFDCRIGIKGRSSWAEIIRVGARQVAPPVKSWKSPRTPSPSARPGRRG
jgi:hypothetical protein